MAVSSKRRSLLLVIPIGFLISTFYVNCSPQVAFSFDYASLSKNGFSMGYTVDEDETLQAKLDVSQILSTLSISKSTVDFKMIGSPGNGKLDSFSAKTGEFQYTPAANFFGQDSFRFEMTILDESKKEEPLVISQVAYINVLPINDPPVLVEKELGVASENGMTDFSILATDVDDTNLRYEILNMSSGGSIQALSGSQFTYYPQCGFKGVEQVTVRVSDSQGASDEGTVTLRVTPDNGTMTLSRTLAQDTVLNDNLLALSSRCVAAGSANSLAVAANPAKGSITNIISSALTYSYKPNSGFYGADAATFVVKNGSFQKSVVVNYTVTHVNKLPSLTKTTYETYQNSSLNITLQISDPDETTIYSYLSAAKENKIKTSLGGSFEKQTGLNDYLYIAPRGLKDVTDQVVVYLVDKSQQFVPFTIKINILANPIATLKPGLAARGLSCTICHAQINANVITDFGHGSSFASNVGGNWSNDPYGNREIAIFDKRYPITPAEAQTLDTIKVWESGKILQTTHVPNAVSPMLGQTYVGHLQSMRPKSYGLVTFPFGDTGDLTSGALAGSSIATAGSFGAVSGYSEVYIGAPTAADITGRMINKALTHEVQGTLQGLVWRAGSQSNYFTNSNSSISCEGDIIVRGTVLLNAVSIATTSGCRIYATGPIFTQGSLNIYSSSGDSSRSNLQLSSSVAIMMGVGMEAVNTRRGYSLPTRGDTGGYNVMATVGTEAANLGSALQDAMRHSSRQVAFSKLLLNAPQVHSRYNSVFRGTIIAEIAVMSPGEFVYYFDDVFLNPSVEILPLLSGPSILKVK